MIATCPHCNEKVDVDYVPKAVYTCSCGKDIKLCPACESAVTTTAAKCKHCGHQLVDLPTSTPLPPQAPTPRPIQYIQKINSPGQSFGALLVVGSFIAIIIGIGGLASKSALGVLTIPALIALLVGVYIYQKKSIKCTNCGYSGTPKMTSSPNGCIFILLLCIGIIPGLIYMLAVKNKYCCPSCGCEAG